MIFIPRLPVLYKMYLAIHLQNTGNCSTVTKYAHMEAIPTVAHPEEDYPTGDDRGCCVTGSSLTLSANQICLDEQGIKSQE